MALAALGPLALASPAAALEQTLLAGDGTPSDLLGTSVAVDGDTAVVGAPADDAGRGSVYVFQRSGATWSNTAKLFASDGEAGDLLGTSVAIDGDTIVAGADDDMVGANDDQGSVYTFARTGSVVRVETAKLTASDGGSGDRLGNSVAIDGDTIVAGAPNDDVAFGDQGSVYTFAHTGVNPRAETAKLTASGGAAGDLLGTSVAIDGDTIVAGAIGDNNGGNDRGSAYTFARTGANPRNETAELTASDGDDVDRLGSSVAIDGDTIVAGAPLDNVGANVNQGSAYTFARTGANPRNETAKLTASDGAGLGPPNDDTDRLGESVAIDGDTIIAGAPGGNVGANVDQGSAYKFARTGANPRNETAKLAASNGAAEDAFGTGLAIDGDTIIAGAPLDNVGANADQGSATVFFDAPPTAIADAPTVAEDSPATAMAVLDNDTDPDGGAKTISSVTQPSFGDVTITGGGTGLTYQPNANYCNSPPGTSPDTFTYTLNGGSIGTVSVTVACSDDSPVAVDDALTVTEDSGATPIDVLLNDTDIDAGSKRVASVTQPANGTVALTGGTAGNHTGLTYQPNPNYCSDPPGTTPDTFTYTLTPGGDTATVSVTVTCVDEATPPASNPASTQPSGTTATRCKKGRKLKKGRCVKKKKKRKK